MTTTDRSALASVATATVARAVSFQTCEAVKAINKPNMMPSGESRPGEMALNDRPYRPASHPVKKWTTAPTRNTAPNVTSAINPNGSSCTHVLIIVVARRAVQTGYFWWVGEVGALTVLHRLG